MKTFLQGFGRWLRDAGERALRAAIVTFTSLTAGSALGIGGATDIGLWKRAAIAALGSAVSVVMSLAAKWAGGDPATASFTKEIPS